MRGWPERQAGLSAAIDDLVGHLKTVGQSTVHQPGVNNMLEAVLAGGQEVPGGLEGERATVLVRMTERFEAARQAMADASVTIARTGSSLLADGDRILVHDFADRSTQTVVRQAAADGKHLTVVATACRTRRADGLRVAREALEEGHHAIVVTDAGIGWAVQTMDLRLCFIGADAVMLDGSVLTTPGALTIALVGSRRGLPVYAVTDLWKLMAEVSPEVHAANELEDPDGVPEALDWKAAGFDYRNPLVDVVPGEALAGLITEAGVIAPAEAGREAARRYGLTAGGSG